MSMLNGQPINTPLRYIRCRVGGDSYALDMAWVRSVERNGRLQPASGEKGLVGHLPTSTGDVPVFSLAQRLGYAREPSTATQRIIILNDPQRAWALLVDQVSQVSQVQASQLAVLPPILSQDQADYFRGMLPDEGGFVLLLAPERLHPDAQQIPRRALRPTLTPTAPTARRELADTAVRSPSNRPGALLLFSVPGLGGNDQRLDVSSPTRPLTFGLSIAQVAEVLIPLPLRPIPNAAPHIAGFVTWRSQPVPVIQLGTPATNGALKSLRLLIVRVPGSQELAGLLVHPTIRLLNLPVPHWPVQRPLPLAPDQISGSVELADETLVIPNIASFLQMEMAW